MHLVSRISRGVKRRWMDWLTWPTRSSRGSWAKGKKHCLLDYHLFDIVLTCYFSRDKLMEHGVRISVIGNMSLIPEHLRKVMAEAMFITKDNDKGYLNIAFAYTCKKMWKLMNTVTHTEIYNWMFYCFSARRDHRDR